ncbi:MAG: cobalamin B12-binding domain-containing protein [Chitinophagaceae bacterium]|nr:cobalamin B12-binding domain-containing protein [Rubrivivax sp.]
MRSAECRHLPDGFDGSVSPEAIDAPRAPSPQERLARIVRTIESDIIPRLVRAHQPAPGAAAPVSVTVLPTAADVQLCVQHMLAADDAGWQTLLDRLLSKGVRVDEIYLSLLSPSAQELGRLWDEDRCSFTDVTVALGRLQRVMRMLSPAFGREVEHPADGRRVLLLPAPGEQHTFGLSIVAEFFRRAGWEVVGDSEARAVDPAALVRSEWFDVIGISVGLDTRLDWLQSGIAAVRNASRNRGIGVMVGGPPFVLNPGRAAELGADGTAADGRQAPLVAEQLLALRQARL